MNKMDEAVQACLRANAMLAPGDTVFVGFSGGADSVSLLHYLHTHRDALQIQVRAAHIHHGIRGAQADRDAAFCAAFCARFGISLETVYVDVPAAVRQSGESEETCARRLRYAALENIAQTDKIATAHTADDNTETVLWHLTRGTGLAGLCGIPPVRGQIIRPLLYATRAQVEAYCRENALEFVTDSTNLSDAYTRNRLRHTVLPVLRDLNPALTQAVTRMCGILRSEQAAAAFFAEQALQGIDTEHLCIKTLLSLPKATAMRILQTVLEGKTGVMLSAVQLESAYRLLTHTGSLSLPNGVRLRSRAGFLEFPQTSEEPPPFCIALADLQFPCTLALPNGTLEIQKYTQKDLQNFHKPLLANAVDCDKLYNAVFRSRQSGDAFTDAHRGVTKTVKKWMNELKIPPEARSSVCLLADANGVLWFSPCGVSPRAKVQRDTKEFLLLTYNYGGNTNE